MNRLIVLGACVLTAAAPSAVWAGQDGNKELVKRYILEVWNQGDMAAADAVLAEDFIRLGPTARNSSHGRQAFKDYVAKVRGAYGQLRITIDELSADGDRVTVSWTARGAYNGTEDVPVPSPKSIEVGGTSMAWLANGKIVKEQASWDVLSWYKQVGVAPPVEDAQRNAALVRRAINEFYNKGNADAADELCAAHYVGHYLGGGQTVQGIAAVKESIANARKAFPDLYLTVDDIVADQSTVVVRWVARGTHKGDYLGIAGTGRPVKVGGLTMYRLEGGKIVEAWSGWDRAALFKQLGVEVPGQKDMD